MSQHHVCLGSSVSSLRLSCCLQNFPGHERSLAQWPLCTGERPGVPADVRGGLLHSSTYINNNQAAFKILQLTLFSLSLPLFFTLFYSSFTLPLLLNPYCLSLFFTLAIPVSVFQLCSPFTERLAPVMALRPLAESPAVSVTRGDVWG